MRESLLLNFCVVVQLLESMDVLVLGGSHLSLIDTVSRISGLVAIVRQRTCRIHVDHPQAPRSSLTSPSWSLPMSGSAPCTCRAVRAFCAFAQRFRSVVHRRADLLACVSGGWALEVHQNVVRGMAKRSRQKQARHAPMAAAYLNLRILRITPCLAAAQELQVVIGESARRGPHAYAAAFAAAAAAAGGAAGNHPVRFALWP